MSLAPAGCRGRRSLEQLLMSIWQQVVVRVKVQVVDVWMSPPGVPGVVR